MYFLQQYNHLKIIQSEEVACDTQTHKTASKELRHDCEKCETRRNAIQKMLNSKKSMKERIKVLSDEKQRYRGLKQALCRKTKIENALRKKIRNLKKELVSKDATIQGLRHKCHCGSQAVKSKLLKHSKVAMKSRHKSNELLYKVDKCKMMIQNAMLRKEIKDLKAKIDALELEQNRLQTIEQKLFILVWNIKFH